MAAAAEGHHAHLALGLGPRPDDQAALGQADLAGERQGVPLEELADEVLGVIDKLFHCHVFGLSVRLGAWPAT